MPASKRHYYPMLKLVLTTWVSNARTFGTALFDDNFFGSHASESILIASIFIGQMDNKPMTASKLAMYAGIPRPTVIRKLKSLESDGYITIDSKGRATINTDNYDPSTGLCACKTMAKLINRTATKLSKMDT